MMIVTEKRARDKWCPHGRVVEVNDTELHGPFNRYHPASGANFSGVSKCIASGCMSWRWHEPPGDADPEPGYGYCGLSGKPEV